MLVHENDILPFTQVLGEIQPSVSTKQIAGAYLKCSTVPLTFIKLSRVSFERCTFILRQGGEIVSRDIKMGCMFVCEASFGCKLLVDDGFLLRSCYPGRLLHEILIFFLLIGYSCPWLQKSL